MHCSEQLEARRLMAFTTSIAGGVLTVTSGNTAVNLSLAADLGSLRITDSNDASTSVILLTQFNTVSVVGGNGNDRIVPAIDGLAFTVNGGAGNDTLVASSGTNDIRGGTGTDTVDFSSGSAALIITLDDTANDTAFGAASKNVRSDIENVIGGGGNDSITGTQTANVLQGGGGKDTLVGAQGNDTLSGGNKNDSLVGQRGADFLVGGAGTLDIVSYEEKREPVSITIDDLANDGVQAESDNIAATAEGFVGGIGNDSIIGSGKPNLIFGGAGDDTLRGGSGNDSITGGAGLDSILGESGNDQLFGLDGQIDTLSGGSGTDSASSDSNDVIIAIP